MEIKKKQFPIGIQNFAELRQGNYYYVDKTAKIIELINTSKYIFLSRPRRFGKSLTLDTIAELFAGNKPLFTGLYAENNWDWGVKYPVIRISFGGGASSKNNQVSDVISDTLQFLEEKWQVTNIKTTTSGRFKAIIEKCYQSTGKKVVILVDEYDKPILDNLTDPSKAIVICNELRDFYGVIKDSDAYIHFAMLTGVSKFSKINLFSGLNNLYDVTLDRRFSALCGYTQTELESVFAPELDQVNLEELKQWYNGYNWTGEAVYNPFDILLFLEDPLKTYKPYWIETGNATFLIDKLIGERVNLALLEKGFVDNEVLSSFEVGDISPIALLFQTGYLTIDSVGNKLGMIAYTLKLPNKEVQQSLHRLVLNQYLNKQIDTFAPRSEIYDSLLANDLNKLEITIKAFFASIPHNWHRNNLIANYEGYWASVFYALFASLGFQTITEDATSLGNIDMTLIVDNHIYIFEFKVIGGQTDQPQGTALAQIQHKRYADKYKTPNHIIHQIGIEFNKETHAVVFDRGEG